MYKVIYCLLLLVFASEVANAQVGSTQEKIGDIAKYGIPALALGSTLIWKDEDNATLDCLNRRSRTGCPATVRPPSRGVGVGRGSPHLTARASFWNRSPTAGAGAGVAGAAAAAAVVVVGRREWRAPAACSPVFAGAVPQ